MEAEAVGDGFGDGMLMESFLEAGIGVGEGSTKGRVTEVWDFEGEEMLWNSDLEKGKLFLLKTTWRAIYTRPEGIWRHL
jgi:hypothetical protein